MRVTVLSDRRSNNGKAFVEPLRKNRRLLADLGLNVTFVFDDPHAAGLTECDQLWINSKVFKTWWSGDKERLLELFSRYRAAVGTVCYFDTTDSSGTVQHEVLPYVVRYYKTFLLKDRNLYLRRFYGGRIYTDFYHRKFSICDESESPEILGAVPDDALLDKLRPAWSPALAYVPGRSLLQRFAGGAACVSPDRPRPRPISCRINTDYSRATVRYQREQLALRLQQHGVPSAKIGRKEYFAELRTSGICISPFGWGEFAYRDYDAIISGAALMKPDMAHIETWPDLYRDGLYQPFRWDFADFEQTLDRLLAAPAAARDMARDAQQQFRRHRETKAGREAFCDRVLAIVKESSKLQGES